MITGGRECVGWGIDWGFGIDMYTLQYLKIDNQQGTTVQHRETCSIFCNNLNGKRIWKRLDKCVCKTESLWFIPETIKTLLISYCCCPIAQLSLTLCDPMGCNMPGFPVLHFSQSLLKLMSIESVMLSNHLILCCPLLLLLSIFPSIRVFSSESAPHIRWPKYWSFSFSISPLTEYSGLISFRMDWFNSLQSKGLSRVFFSTIVQKHRFFSAQPSLRSNSHIRTWQLEKP